MELLFSNECNPGFDEYEDVFAALALKTLAHLHVEAEALIEVELVANEAIHALNKTYRGIDRPTDVLSFAFTDEVTGEVKIKNAPFVNLGAIVISVDQAMAQAASYGHDIRRELSFLFVHGLLHLLGYDHGDAVKEKEMFALQDAIIGKRITK